MLNFPPVLNALNVYNASVSIPIVNQKLSVSRRVLSDIQSSQFFVYILNADKENSKFRQMLVNFYQCSKRISR